MGSKGNVKVKITIEKNPKEKLCIKLALWKNEINPFQKKWIKWQPKHN